MRSTVDASTCLEESTTVGGDNDLKNFVLTGVGGFIAPRHLQAIKQTGNRLLAALDPKDSVGVMDQYFPEARFFTEFERFDRYVEKLRREDPKNKIDYLSICTPNYLHDAHVRLALRIGADAICEKPLVISPWNIDALQALEQETGRKIYNVLQLRLLPQLVAFHRELTAATNRKKADVSLSYITRRGPWYQVSWKGDVTKSGGVPMNIGIHFFDMLLWFFGAYERHEVHHLSATKAAGYIELEWARVKWFLSVDKEDLPVEAQKAGKTAFRSIKMDDREIEFSDGFTDLHTRVYEDIMKGGGFGLSSARPSIDLAYKMRTSTVVPPTKATGHAKILGG